MPRPRRARRRLAPPPFAFESRFFLIAEPCLPHRGGDLLFCLAAIFQGLPRCPPDCPCRVRDAARRADSGFSPERVRVLQEREQARRPRFSCCRRCGWEVPPCPQVPAGPEVLPSGGGLSSADRRCALSSCGAVLSGTRRKFCIDAHERAYHGRSGGGQATAHRAVLRAVLEDDEDGIPEVLLDDWGQGRGGREFGTQTAALRRWRQARKRAREEERED